MSEAFSSVFPPDPRDPENKEFTRAFTRSPGAALSLIPGMLAQVLPAARNEQGETRLEIPGVATSIYGGVGAGGPMAINYVGGKMGYNPQVPPAPGALDALRRYEDTSRLANDIIPVSQLAENETEAGLHRAMFSAGGMVSPIPGAAVTNLATKVPTALGRGAAKVAGHVAIPTKEGIAVGAPAMGGISLLGEQDVDEFGVPIQKQQATQPSQGQAGVGGPTTLPFNTTSTPSTTTEVDEFGVPIGKVADPPTYSAQGKSSIPFGQELAMGLGGAAVVWGVMKHGGKLLNPIVDAFQGVDTSVARHNANLDAIDVLKTAQPTTSLSGGPPRGEAPGVARFTTRVADKLWDSNRIVNDFTGQIAPNKQVAKEMEATTGMTNGSSALSNRIAAQMRTGVPTVGQPGVKLFDVVKKIDALTTGEHETLNYGLWAADELNTRLIKFNKAKQDGSSLADKDLRFNFKNEDSATLRAARDLMMNDPKLAAIKDEIKRMHIEHIDNMELRGRITTAVARDIKATRPDYISSVDKDGKISQVFGERNIDTWFGQQDMPTRAIDAIVQHYGAIYSDMAHNEWLRNIVLTATREQQANPARARVFTEKLGPNKEYMAGSESDERVVTIHTADGPRTFYTDNTALHGALTANNTQIGMLLNTANALKNLLQRGTTGVSATIVGQSPFAPKAFLRNAQQIQIDRSPDTWGSLADKWLQQKGYSGYRGFEPTFYVGAANEAARAAAAHTAKNLGDMLMTRSTPVSQMFRQLKGDAWVDAAAARMHQRFADSRVAGRESAGVGGGGSYGLNEPPTFQVTSGRGNPVNTVVNPLSNASPGLFHEAVTDRINIPFTKVKLPGTNGVVAQYINLRTMLRDIHNSIQEGPNAYYYELNRDNPKLSANRRAYEANRVLGDPGMSGSSKLALGLGRSLPYVNPMVQDTVRFMRNFRDNPITFTAATMQRLAISAAASTLTAMLMGRRAVDHLENQITTQQRAADVIFYHDTDPNNHTKITLPQRDRALYPLILEIFATGVGAFEAHKDENIFNRTIHMLADVFNHHVSNSTHTSMMHGLGDQFDVMVPPTISVPLGLFGAELNKPVSNMIMNAYEGDPLTSGVVRQWDAPNTRPGAREGDTLISHNDGTWLQHFFQNLLGAAGKGYQTFYENPRQRLSEGATPGEAMLGVLSDAGQNLRDAAPYGNFVWGNNVRANRFNPMEEANSNRIRNLKALESPNTMNSQGFASPGSSMPVITLGKPKLPTDPVLMQMYGLGYQTYQSLAPFLKESQDTKTAIDRINSSGYSAQQKRSFGNQLVAKHNEVLAKIDGQLKTLNAALSTMAGGRHVDIGQTIDWQGTVDQFHH